MIHLRIISTDLILWLIVPFSLYNSPNRVSRLAKERAEKETKSSCAELLGEINADNSLLSLLITEPLLVITGCVLCCSFLHSFTTLRSDDERRITSYAYVATFCKVDKYQFSTQKLLYQIFFSRSGSPG